MSMSKQREVKESGMQMEKEKSQLSIVVDGEEEMMFFKTLLKHLRKLQDKEKLQFQKECLTMVLKWVYNCGPGNEENKDVEYIVLDSDDEDDDAAKVPAQKSKNVSDKHSDINNASENVIKKDKIKREPEFRITKERQSPKSDQLQFNSQFEQRLRYIEEQTMLNALQYQYQRHQLSIPASIEPQPPAAHNGSSEASIPINRGNEAEGAMDLSL